MSHIHIKLEHVSFGYEKSNPVLKDVTFTANEHDSIGLIGANGVGKSTLLKNITSDYHYHTVTADSEDILNAIESELDAMGYLIRKN